MFVDASAIVTILAAEPEADAFADAIHAAPGSITSPIAIYEAVLALCRKRQVSVEAATATVVKFLDVFGITTTPISPEEGTVALNAFARYGKARGHPAQLNLGDCFAYAAAKTRGVPLLFKGEDFDKTDIPRAAP